MPHKRFAVSLLFGLIVVSTAAAQDARRSFPLQATAETGPRDWYISMSEARTEEGRVKLRKLIRGEFSLSRRLQQVVRLAAAGDRSSGKLLVRTYDEAEYRQDYKGMEKLVLALGDIAVAGATPRMIEATKSGNARIRLTGVMLLGRAGDKRAVPALIALLNDSDDDVADAVIWALSNLTGQPPEVRSRAEWSQWWSENQESFPDITVLSIQRNILTRAPTAEKQPVFASKERAIKSLGALGDPEAILIFAETVRAALEWETPDTREGVGEGPRERGAKGFVSLSADLVCRRIAGKSFGLAYETSAATADALEAWYNQHVKSLKPEGGGR